MPSKYRVGYGRPPLHSRFRKGHSGNPRGRPKGTRNLATDLAEELGERIHIRENERPIRVSKQRALIKALTAQAIKGDTRAAALLVNLLWRVLEREGPPTVDQPLSQDDEAVLAAFLARHRASRTDPKESP